MPLTIGISMLEVIPATGAKFSCQRGNGANRSRDPDSNKTSLTRESRSTSSMTCMEVVMGFSILPIVDLQVGLLHGEPYHVILSDGLPVRVLGFALFCHELIDKSSCDCWN